MNRIAASIFAAMLHAVMLSPAHAATVGPALQIGTLESQMLKEVSGLAASRSLVNTLWVHNDSGDTARFFAISTGGSLLGAFSLTGATATDWEDMSIGPKPGGGNYLYFADIGDNAAARSDVLIHRLTEPLSADGGSIAPAQYSTLTLQYPGGARDAESMLVDPITGDLFIISKGLTAAVFRAPATAFESAQPVMLTSLGNLGSSMSFATGAAISPDGAFILVRSYGTTARLFERGPGQSVADALLAPGASVTIASESQGESIAWSADGFRVLTTSEFGDGASEPIYYYNFTAPEPMGIVLGIMGIAAALVFRGFRERRSCGTV